jgi:hypothetical protein
MNVKQRIENFFEQRRINNIINQEKLVEQIRINNIINQLGLSEFNDRNNNHYYSLKDPKITFPENKIYSIVQDALKTGKSSVVLDTWIRNEVDENTSPPDGNDYSAGERRDRDHYSKDMATIEIADGKPVLSVKHLEDYATTWRW